MKPRLSEALRDCASKLAEICKELEAANVCLDHGDPFLREMTAQVVVFASEGVVRSVAIRRRSLGAVPCVLVDYDNRHGDERTVPIEEYERALLGMTREEFDRAATYIL